MKPYHEVILHYIYKYSGFKDSSIQHQDYADSINSFHKFDDTLELKPLEIEDEPFFASVLKMFTTSGFGKLIQKNCPSFKICHSKDTLLDVFACGKLDGVLDFGSEDYCGYLTESTQSHISQNRPSYIASFVFSYGIYGSSVLHCSMSN